MTAKELLRERIEELSERIDEISDERAADWLSALDELSDWEPGPVTPEQRALIEQGLSDLDAGRKLTRDEALRRLGIRQ